MLAPIVGPRRLTRVRVAAWVLVGRSAPVSGRKQPPDRKEPAVPTTGRVVQRGDEAELYRQYDRALVSSVARSVNASRELIEDACQTAWLILLRRQPDRDGVFGWLRTVAIYEAYRLSGVERRDARLDAPVLPDAAIFGHERVQDPRACLDRQLEARLALARVGELPARQRRLFALQIAGLTYAQTAAVTGDSVRTVDRQLRRAHARVRGQPVE